MNIVTIGPGGSVYEHIGVSCPHCHNPATVLIRTHSLPDYFACDDCKSEAIKASITAMLRIQRDYRKE